MVKRVNGKSSSSSPKNLYSCRGKGRLLSSAVLTSDARGSGLNFASAPLAFQMLSQWFEQLSSKPNSKGSHNNQACNFPSSVVL